MARSERYALLSDEVLRSAAYHALPDWAVRVLLALAAQYRGARNGSLALPVADARAYGVCQPWRVYAGLRLLCDAQLAICTRRGHLTLGGKLASMYAITWRGIDAPADGIVYDAGIAVCPTPSHAWADWTRPDDWDARVREIVRRMRGPSGAERAARAVTRLSGTDRTRQSGTDDAHIVPAGRVRRPRTIAPAGRVTSEIWGRGAHDHDIDTPSLTRGRAHPKKNGDTRKIKKLLTTLSHLTDADAAKICNQPIERVREVRAQMEGRR